MISVAVGTGLRFAGSARPPHRSQRAGLPHWAPGLDTNVKSRIRPRMHDLGRREPSVRKAGHAFPIQAGALAAAPKRLMPVPGRLEPESVDRLNVAGHGVVAEVSPDHRAEPPALLGDGQMHAPPALGLDLVQLCPQPLRVGDALELKAPVPGLPANVREAKELERLRLSKAAGLSPPGGEPAELDQPRLLRRQLQAEPRKPAAKISQEPLSVTAMLEAHHVVVGEAHDDHVTMRVPPPPLVGPQVEHVMEVNV